MISVSNPNLIRLPRFNFSGDNASSNGVVTVYTTTGTGRQTSSALLFEQTLLNETSIDVELRDQTFLVDVPNLFLVIDNGSKTPNNIDNQQRAYYTLTSSGRTSNLGSSLSFKINSKSLTQTMFDVYGPGTTRDTIKSYVRVTGMQSGAVKDIAVQIKK